jgi:hypothetical protein
VQFEQLREESMPRVGQPRERSPSYLSVFGSEKVQAQAILSRVEELYGKGNE